ncbi:hypothetical protein ACHAW6_003839 [Cyclotella cf. meneghiniana]
MTNTCTKVYDPMNPDLNIDCDENYQELDVFGNDPMAASEFDCRLSVKQFLQLYSAAMKWCKKSGENKDFLNYINGLIWLGYLCCMFMSVGDSSLHDTAFSELPAGVLNESTDGAPGVRKSRSRSTSPVPPSSSKKQAASVPFKELPLHLAIE